MSAKTVIGVGGIFLQANDPEALYAWYEKHFGLQREHGCFSFPPDAGPGSVVLAFFPKGAKNFAPSQPAMLNFRVTDLEATVAALKAAGVPVEDKREDYGFGQFGWCADPEGNRVEMWQPVD